MKSLQNLSYKTLLTIFIFSLAGIVFFLKIGGKTQKVSAAWWDDMWHYRKAISIDNSSGSDLTDFQVALSIGTSQLIADGKMQNNCNDIRITDINGNLLPYWIETTGTNKCNQTADTRIWIKANSLPTSGSTVYIYYGNPSADNQSSGQNTFIYFKDNFQTSDVDWNWSNGGVENGWAKTWANGNDSPGSTMVWLKNIIDITNQEVVVEFTVKSTKSGTLGHTTTNVLFNPTRNTTLYNNTSSSTIANGNGNSIITFGDYTNWYGKVGFDSSTGQASNITNSTSYPLYQFNTEGWVRHVHKLTNSGLLLSGYSLGGLDTNSNPWVYTEKTVTSGYTKPNSIILAIGEQYNETTWMSEAFVRKYASTQPTTSIQSEETGGGPIAYWKFDEGSGTTAYDSAGTSNGTISGATYTPEDQCISGKCLSFNGPNNNYLDTTNILNFTNVTFSTWVKISSSFPAGSRIGNIIGNYSSTNNINIEGYTNGRIRVYWNSGQINLYGNIDLRDDKWHLVSIVRNNITNKISIYIDSKIDTETTAGSDISVTKPFRIGGDYRNGDPPNNPGIPFTGLIDEVKIYPYARTADQIKLDYNSRGSLSGSGANLGVQSNTAPSLKSSLVAHYKFDEGVGTTTYDSSYQQKNTSIIGSPLPTWVNNGKFGKALDFNASGQRVVIDTTTSLSGQATTTLWYKRTNTASTSWRTILGDKTANIHQLIIHNTNRDIGIFDGSWRDFGFNPPDDNQFHYYAVIYDIGTSASLYVDGLYKNKIYTTLNLTTNPIGSIGNWSGNNYWAGIIDEVKIYNKALTPEEIKQDYNQGSAIQFGSTTQNIGGTTTSLDYCIPGDTSYCATPVAEWNFEENTGTTAKDTSGNNNNFTFNIGTSAPTWAVGKKNKGSSLQFNGTSNWVQRTLSPSIPANTDYTQCLWFNPTSNTTRQVMIDDANQWEHWIALNTNRTVMGCYYNTAQICTTSSTTINLNTWNHACLSVQSGQKMSLYLNGTLVSENTNIGSSLPKIYDDVCVGANGGSVHGEKFSGKIDDVKIYNYARTPAQIAYDYNRGAPVGWWKFDECQGSVINDSSGNNNSGNISIGLSGSQTTLGTCQTGTSAAWTNGASGHINSSLNFDGNDDYISVPNPSNNLFNFNTNNFSISTWLYKPSGGKQLPGIISKNGSPGWRLTINTDYITFGIYNGSTWTSYSANSAKFNFNSWQLITVVLNRTGNADFYINGILKQSIDISGTSSVNLTNSASLLLADDNWCRNETCGQLDGQLDDVRIYNYALTSEQVKQVYNGGAINFQ